MEILVGVSYRAVKCARELYGLAGDVKIRG